MSLAELINQPCTIVRRSEAEEEEFGEPTRTETRVETVCHIQQRRRDEPGALGEVSETDWLAFFMPDEQLRTGDAVETEGWVYELIGDPWVADQGSPEVHHIEATLRRVAGTAEAS